MGYTVNDETIRLNQEAIALSSIERRYTRQAQDIWLDVQKKLQEHAELMLMLGEFRTLLRQKEEELENAVNGR